VAAERDGGTHLELHRRSHPGHDNADAHVSEGVAPGACRRGSGALDVDAPVDAHLTTVSGRRHHDEALTQVGDRLRVVVANALLDGTSDSRTLRRLCGHVVTSSAHTVIETSSTAP